MTLEHRLKVAILATSAYIVSTVLAAAGCSDLWEVPKDHIDGVNEFGYVSFWDKIAEIDIGEDQPFPIVIGFESNRGKSSPYLGYGWVLPLFESYIVQTSENTFEIMKPTGYTSGFGRDPKNATAIGGVQGWKGEIGTDTIKAWAPCGWNLSYSRGKLTEIGTPKGKRILLKRDSNGQVDDITMDGRILVKVLKGFGGKVEGFEVEGKRLDIELGEKPRVENIAGKNVIAGKDLSLAKIETKEGQANKAKVFEYGPTSSLQPILTCKQADLPDREIVWDALSKFIVSDGKWNYDIQPSTIAGDTAAIARRNAKGESEFWQCKTSTGEEILQKADGSCIKTTRFVSGLLAGKLRAVEKYQNNELRFYERYSYDDKNNLLRIQKPDGCVTFKNGLPAEVVRNGMTIWSYEGKTLTKKSTAK